MFFSCKECNLIMYVKYKIPGRRRREWEEGVGAGDGHWGGWVGGGGGGGGGGW